MTNTPPRRSGQPYAALGAFAAPAVPRCELWRTLAGLAVAGVAGLTLYQLVLSLIAGLLGPARMRALLDETTFHGDTAFGTLWMLFAFGFLAVGMALALRGVHARAPASVFGPPGPALRQFAAVAGAVGALQVALLVLLPRDVEILRNAAMPLGLWLALLPLSLGAILVQAGTEEALFRGYLQQQIAARFPRAVLWMVLPALLFGLAHHAPSNGSNAGLFTLWAVAFGVAAADLTARAGTLGPAIALHVVNNAAALLGAALLGPGSGLALFHLQMRADDPSLAALMPGELGVLLVSWLAARVALRV